MNVRPVPGPIGAWPGGQTSNAKSIYLPVNRREWGWRQPSGFGCQTWVLGHPRRLRSGSWGLGLGAATAAGGPPPARLLAENCPAPSSLFRTTAFPLRPRCL